MGSGRDGRASGGAWKKRPQRRRSAQYTGTQGMWQRRSVGRQGRLWRARIGCHGGSHLLRARGVAEIQESVHYVHCELSFSTRTLSTFLVGADLTAARVRSVRVARCKCSQRGLESVEGWGGCFAGDAWMLSYFCSVRLGCHVGRRGYRPTLIPEFQCPPIGGDGHQ